MDTRGIDKLREAKREPCLTGGYVVGKERLPTRGRMRTRSRNKCLAKAVPLLTGQIRLGVGGPPVRWETLVPVAPAPC